METLVVIFGVFFLLGIVYALRHAIAHLILTTIAVLIILYFLGTPEQNGWWSLIGFFIILVQLGMAKEAMNGSAMAEVVRLSAANEKRAKERDAYFKKHGLR